tara:strand:+ start:1507 stop:1617 length:111 start_codon:yes stop_codon:yes gene_type:complete
VKKWKFSNAVVLTAFAGVMAWWAVYELVIYIGGGYA